jgi:hypothetical protein
MVISRIPKTNIRLKHLIKIYSGQQNPAQAFDLQNANFKTLITDITSAPAIGGVKTLSVKSERELYSWRELNYATLGKIMEVYPSLGEFSISASKIAFYAEHLIDAFQAVKQGDVFNGTEGDMLSAGLNIYNQIAPLYILIDVLTPNATTGSKAFDPDKSDNIEVLLYDCWFDKSEIEFDVTDDDLALVQDAELTCAGIYTSNKNG